MRNIHDRLSEAESQEIVQRHMANPHVSAKDYWHQKTQELGQSISARKKIYLDTCYWVHLRNAAMGRAKNQDHDLILQLLRGLVKSGVVLCPVSDMAFAELMGQTDDISRLETAKLLDELSLSIALQFEEHRIRCELETFFLSPMEPEAKKLIINKMWTRPPYVFGPRVPTTTSIPPELDLAFQKASIDLFWGATFVDMSEQSMADLAMGKGFDDTASRINSVKSNFQHEIPSIERALVAEVAGLADFYLDHAESIIVEQYRREGNRGPLSDSETDRQQHRTTLRNVLVNVFVFAKEKAKYKLPSIYAHSLAHAAFRMDPSRKFKGSFLRDIHHGTAGVVWFDSMLTERPLQVLLTRNDVALDKTFGCQVLSSTTEVIRYLESIST